MEYHCYFIIIIIIIITGTTALCGPCPSSELFAILLHSTLYSGRLRSSGYSFLGFLNNLVFTV
jgi:hypothetical protein